MLGRSNSQSELNPFLFQAELPPPFWPPSVLSSRVNTREQHEIMCGAQTKDDFEIRKANMELIYLFPRELWHTAQPILINVLRNTKMCLSL